MQEPRLQTLRMLGAKATAHSTLNADRHWNRELSIGHIPNLGGVVYQLVHGERHEIREHDLDYGSSPGQCRTDRETHDCSFADGRVDDPGGPKGCGEPRRCTEGATVGNVFAEDEDVVVSLQLLSKDRGDGVDVTDCLRHGCATTFVNRSSRSGHGAASASSAA